MKTQFKSESGMTLMELMIAAGIAATALSLLFGSLMAITSVGKLSQDREAATVELASIMEELRGLAFKDILGYTAPPLPRLGTEAQVFIQYVAAGGTLTALPANTATDAELSTLPNPIELEVTVSWLSKDNNRPMLLTVSSLFMR